MDTGRRVSVVIRTLNEERHLGDLLRSIRSQLGVPAPVEIVLVDSGSTDRTVKIAKDFGCTVLSISRAEFTFGRSLNIGCEAANGDYIVMISGHCIPLGDHWLERLIAPLADGRAAYSYGRQIGGNGSRFSECQLFEKYFPTESLVPQAGIFCNNANAAISRRVWAEHRFDEELTGLEDMELAQRLVSRGHRIGYVADAGVSHLHDESWKQIRKRYTREALALQRIMPQVHISFIDFVRYVSSAILLDSAAALRAGSFVRLLPEIVMFRTMQYWGAFRGNNDHRKLSRQAKEEYFFPR